MTKKYPDCWPLSCPPRHGWEVISYRLNRVGGGMVVWLNLEVGEVGGDWQLFQIPESLITASSFSRITRHWWREGRLANRRWSGRSKTRAWSGYPGPGAQAEMTRTVLRHNNLHGKRIHNCWWLLSSDSKGLQYCRQLQRRLNRKDHIDKMFLEWNEWLFMLGDIASVSSRATVIDALLLQSLVGCFYILILNQCNWKSLLQIYVHVLWVSFIHQIFLLHASPISPMAMSGKSHESEIVKKKKIHFQLD